LTHTYTLNREMLTCS